MIPQGFKFVDYATPKEAIKYYADLFGVKVDADAILKKVILEDSANVTSQSSREARSRRSALAFSLVNDPELVFLDEPTTGLDPQARRAVWEVIRTPQGRRKERACSRPTTSTRPRSYPTSSQ